MTAPPIVSDRKSLIVLTAASLILAACVVGIVLFGAGVGANRLNGRYLLTGLACIAPYLLLLLLLTLRRRPGTVTLGLASGLGIGLSATLVILAVGGTLGRVVVVLTMWSTPIVAGLLMGIIQVAEWMYRMEPIALAMLIVLGIVQFQVAKLAQKARRSAGLGNAGQWTIGRMTGFAILGAGAFAAMSAGSHAQTASVTTFIANQEKKRSEGLDAFHAMVRIQACAATYADSVSKGTYPATLAAMGPDGSKCLDSEVAGGTRSGYGFQYHPISDSSGRNVGWWASSQPLNAARGESGLVADHTGAMYQRRVSYYQPANSSREDSTVFIEPVEYSDLAKWVAGAKCIRDAHAADTVDTGYPAEGTITERRCLGMYRNREVHGDKVLTYEGVRPDRRGRFRSFAVYVTPLHYGRETVRSILIDPDGGVHVTSSQRRATLADPVYTGCELDPRTPCPIAGLVLSNRSN